MYFVSRQELVRRAPTDVKAEMRASAKRQKGRRRRQAPSSPQKRGRVTPSCFKGIAYCLIKASQLARLAHGTSMCASKCPQLPTSSTSRGVTHSKNLLSYAAWFSTPLLPWQAWKTWRGHRATGKPWSSSCHAAESKFSASTFSSAAPG